ncbi:putative membrane protein [Phytophthora megakarya]|uniref:Putative membrane protein n=1 Tax=Phytophthora megakarya TaxID=4795 RepID=A0A225WH50_9STRA|nr:putative membrane protein [Phytophthora megakarya]
MDAAPSAASDLQSTQFSAFETWEPSLAWGILDDDLIDVACVSPNDTVPSTQSPAKKKRKKSGNPNKARDERRFQLIDLNEKVAQLQFTLKQLETIQNKRPKLRGDRIHSPLQNEVPPVWQEICRRQLSRRLEAEQENLRLKQQYERERQLLSTFKKMLFPRQTRNSHAERKHTRRTEVPAGYVERIAALIFEELEVGVKLCYSKVDRFFNTEHHVPMNIVTHSALLDGGKGTERKFYDRRTMPFNMRATGAAWWENWQSYRGGGLRDTEADEIVERFGLEMNDFKTNTSATAFGQQITQRHVENDRIVFVFDAYIEPFGYENDRVDGLYFLEQTYVLVQPENGATTGENGRSSTRISTCYVITPHFLDSKLKEDGKTTALINFLVSAMSSRMMSLSEMVEYLLLDQALQQPISLDSA